IPYLASAPQDVWDQDRLSAKMLPGTADVEERLHRQYGINRNTTNPAFLPRLLELASKVSALESLRVLTLPDMRVALWIKLEIEPALLLENGRKPWIVTPVRVYDHCIVWALLAQKFINGILLPAWVPVGPKFRSFLADRGAQQCQTARAQRLRFLHPRDVQTFERLDRFRCRVLHPLKDNQSIPR